MFARLLEANANEEKLRALIATDAGFDHTHWQEMAKLGLTGILIPSEHSGAGGSLEEVEALMEVAGEFLLSGPFIESSVTAPTLLAACTDHVLSNRLLAEIASGESILTVAGCGKSGDWTLLPDVTAVSQADHWQLQGEAHFVSYPHVAKQCLVYANTESGVGVFLVSMDDPGLSVKVHAADDKTQRPATLNFNNARSVLLEGVGEQSRTDALNNALVALAGQQVGGSQKMFALTVDYLKTRHQFGEPIGRFQALKHMAADLLVELESATSAARHAAATVASGSEQATQASCLAAFSCADNFRKITADAIQLHGGIAYTIEHPAHLYWRRAQSGLWAYCSSDKLRDLYLTEMEKTL